ncbi:MAG: hypothetical protein V3V00_02060 [Saprospiraceae bacterium]
MKSIVKSIGLVGLWIMLHSSCNLSTQNKIEVIKERSNIVIQGSFFHGSNGLYFDDNDRLHVASVVSRYIGVVDTDTGAIIDTLTTADGVEGPDDLTFGPDGSLYFTSILTGEVGRIAPDGKVSRQFVSPGTNPITFSDDGRLFVALDFQGDGLYELDPELKNPPRLIIKELGWLNAMDFGPDGYLYGPIWSKGQIVKIDVDNASLDIIVDDLEIPAAVKFDSKGNLYTVDHKTGMIYTIDLKDGSKSEIASGFMAGDNIAFNSEDELFISNAQDGSIYQINSDGSRREVIAPSLCNAADVEVVNGKLIIPDILSMKSYDIDGAIDRQWYHMIGAPGIIGPFTVDAEGDHLALTSWFGNEVQIWNIKTDKALATYHDYAVPINAIIYKGALIVAELGTSQGGAKVSRRNNGNIETLLDAKGGLVVPSGLACDKGNCYVADFYRGVVFQITENGDKMTAAKVLLEGLIQPEGLQIGPKGRLIIVETGANKVSAYDLNTNEISSLVDNIALGLEGPKGVPPTWKFSDVHFDSDGVLYVPSDVDNVVYKYDGVF